MSDEAHYLRKKDFSEFGWVLVSSVNPNNDVSLEGFTDCNVRWLPYCYFPRLALTKY